MKIKSIVWVMVFISTTIYSQSLVKNRVQVHQLKDTINIFLTEIGAYSVKEAIYKVKRLNELLGYLQAPSVPKAIKKIKKTNVLLYKKEKRNEKLIQKNKRLIAHTQTLESTLKDIIKIKKENAKHHQAQSDIFAKIPKKLPKIAKR